MVSLGISVLLGFNEPPRRRPAGGDCATGRSPSEHLLALLLRAGGAYGRFHVLLLFRRRQHGGHPERLEAELPAPSLAVVQMLVLFLLDLTACLLELALRFALGALLRIGAQQLPVCVVLGFRQDDTFAG